MSVQVEAVARDAVVWPFNNRPPYVKIGGRRGHLVEVDPVPAYTHDAALVERWAQITAAFFPIDWPVTICILPYEEIGRTNGATYVDVDYDGAKDEKGIYHGRLASIFLSAKRIPIHPAVTRYVVAHEYGHVVEEWLNERRGNTLYDDHLIRDYAALRLLDYGETRGAGVWHRLPTEVFADDFRILVCQIEETYWPHPGIEHPHDMPSVKAWWREAAA